jgi:hypothetical protein
MREFHAGDLSEFYEDILPRGISVEFYYHPVGIKLSKLSISCSSCGRAEALRKFIGLGTVVDCVYELREHRNVKRVVPAIPENFITDNPFKHSWPFHCGMSYEKALKAAGF